MGGLVHEALIYGMQDHKYATLGDFTCKYKYLDFITQVWDDR
jgi:hypothetical protein